MALDYQETQLFVQGWHQFFWFITSALSLWGCFWRKRFAKHSGALLVNKNTTNACKTEKTTFKFFLPSKQKIPKNHRIKKKTKKTKQQPKTKHPPPRTNTHKAFKQHKPPNIFPPSFLAISQLSGLISWSWYNKPWNNLGKSLWVEFFYFRNPEIKSRNCDYIQTSFQHKHPSGFSLEERANWLRECKISFWVFGTCFEDLSADRQVSSALGKQPLAEVAEHTQADLTSWEELSAWLSPRAALPLLFLPHNCQLPSGRVRGNGRSAGGRAGTAGLTPQHRLLSVCRDREQPLCLCPGPAGSLSPAAAPCLLNALGFVKNEAFLIC